MKIVYQQNQLQARIELHDQRSCIGIPSQKFKQQTINPAISLNYSADNNHSRLSRAFSLYVILYFLCRAEPMVVSDTCPLVSCSFRSGSRCLFGQSLTIPAGSNISINHSNNQCSFRSFSYLNRILRHKSLPGIDTHSAALSLSWQHYGWRACFDDPSV